jgi:Carboxypeptidase regulatory-like domain
MLERALTCITVALVAVSAAITGATEQAAVTVRRTGLIVGQVIDGNNGRPISGAIVTITGTTLRSGGAVFVSPGPSTPRILTGADGRFVFRDLPQGNFTISATKSGYADGAHGRRRPGGLAQPLSLDEDERMGDVVILMWKYSAISGMVVDEAGEPVIGATVRAYRRSFGAGARRFVNESAANTDDRGIYRVSSLLPGEYVVSTSSRQVAVPLSFVGTAGLRREGTTTLQLGDTFYSIAPGGTIPPAPAGDRLFIYPPTFHISSPSPGEAMTIAVAAGEERDGIDLHLRPVRTVRVSGTLSGPDGASFATSIRLLPADVDRIVVDQDVPEALTDFSGAFTFPAVPPGEYSLRAEVLPNPKQPGVARADATQWAHVPVTVGESDIKDLAVVLQNGLRISGSVAFEGITDRPAGSHLQFPLLIEAADPRQSAAAGALGTVQVTGNGQFTTAGLPAGRYFVRVSGSPVGWMFKAALHNGIDLSETPFDLSTDVDDVVVTFTDRWTGVRGTVRTAQAQPDGRAAVLIFPTDPQWWTGEGFSPRRMRNVRASKAGEFSATSMPAGDYYVIAVPEERASDWQDTSFLETLARAAMHVTLSEGDQKTLDLRTREVR